MFPFDLSPPSSIVLVSPIWYETLLMTVFLFSSFVVFNSTGITSTFPQLGLLPAVARLRMK